MGWFSKNAPSQITSASYPSVASAVAINTGFGSVKTNAKEAKKHPCEMVPMKDREGYIECTHCLYCNPSRSTGLGTCVKDGKGAEVYAGFGCFGGKPIPEEMLMAHALMDTRVCVDGIQTAPMDSRVVTRR